MVKCVKLERNKAEFERRKLVSQGLLNPSYVPLRDGKYVYFALVGKIPSTFKTVEKKLIKREEYGKPFWEVISGKLTAKEKNELVTSFDVVGDIATMEISPSLVKKEQLIATAVMKMHKNIKVVAKKTGGTSGKFRIRPVKVLAGEKRTHTIHKESGCAFELDINKTYFSHRLGTERARIAALVKKNENVLVPFAGVGPFALVIAKKVPSSNIVGIELNPDAVAYFRQNIVRNKCANVTVLEGDVSKLLPAKYIGWADRIIMPLPKDSSEFLSNAISSLKRGGILHYYSFEDSAHPYNKATEQVRLAASALGRIAKVEFKRIVRPYSKTTVQTVLDVRVN